MTTNRSIPDADVIPVLMYEQVSTAVDWLRDTFGFAERLRIGDHRVQLTFGAGAIVVAEGGSAQAGSSHSILLRVPDVDSLWSRATTTGAKDIRPPTDNPFGERQCTVIDPGGHSWTLSQTIADSDPADWGGVLAAPLAASTAATHQSDATSWLALADARNVTASWNSAGAAFRDAITAERWGEALATARAPLGELTSRALAVEQQLDGLPGSPPGSYRVQQYHAVYGAVKAVVETLTLQQEIDGAWRVVGYFIR